ncbi:hypothetical protein ACFWFI_24025 [Streptomyces sp. NPDC060209]|uniref:hypothetical protein n=1 Tax=Streptomyces sp. NPDC060209 TaxID=3347073 RepID=UPI0036605F20
MNDHPDDIALVSDPQVIEVALKDHEDELVDCRGLLRVDSCRSDPRGDRAHLRVGAAEPRSPHPDFDEDEIRTANHATESRHRSYGDRNWARSTGVDAAVYGWPLARGCAA